MIVNGVMNHTNKYPTNNEKYQEAGKSSETEKNTEKSSTSDYLDKLHKQVPHIDLKINPKLLFKMQNDPEKEKEYTQRLKDIERAQKWLDGYMKSRGYTTKISQWYIDENGKVSHLGYHVKEDKLSPKLREERKENTEKLIEKTKEQSAEKKKELAEKLLNNKMFAEEQGKVHLSDKEIQIIIEAAKEQNRSKTDGSEQDAAGVYLDMQI